MKYSRQDPYFATLQDRYLLNKAGSTKKTYHISLKIKAGSISYKPGDSIGVIPLNDRKLIEKTLHFLKISNLSKKETKTLNSVNLCKATKKLLQHICQNAKSNFYKTEIENLISNKQNLKEFLNSYQVWEVLQKYPIDISLENLCSTLRPMLPRFYSIASSSNTIKDEIHLLVAENTYFLRNRLCHGVGSNYLCKAIKINEPVAIYVQASAHFMLPKELKTPIIMIGPGTGIAPFKAFLQERCHALHATKNWLFFGERNKSYDYYYQDYLEKLRLNNQLELDTAFSRDQTQKIYVQDLIKEKGELFFKWIENNAVIYVCGDAKKMAKSVEDAILKVFQTHGKMSLQESQKYLKNLRKNKRYLCDVY